MFIEEFKTEDQISVYGFTEVTFEPSWGDGSVYL